MNWGKYICGLSLAAGLLALILLWIKWPSEYFLAVIVFWVALWTIGYLLISKPDQVWWKQNWQSSLQALSAIVMASLTVVLVMYNIKLVNITEQYTKFTQDIKKFQQEDFIFRELQKSKIQPVTVKLDCNCQSDIQDNTPRPTSRYTCKSFTLYLTNNASVPLDVIKTTAWVQKNMSERESLATARNIDLPKLWPNEKILLTEEVNTNLASFKQNIDRVYITTEYYTPTRTLLSQNEVFSFPLCQ